MAHRDARCGGVGHLRVVTLVLAAAGVALALAAAAGPANLGVTELVSVNSAGEQQNNWGQANAAISLDGRFVAFDSTASNLVPGDTADGTDQIYVHDRSTGSTERVSDDNAGQKAQGDSTLLGFVGGSRYVAFVTGAPNLGGASVYLRDRETATTASVPLPGYPATSLQSAQFSDDGRYVAFNSTSTTIASGDGNGSLNDVFVLDRQSSTTAQRVSRATGASGSGANKAAFNAAISADGRYVCFTSAATNLVVGDTNNVSDVFVRDLQAATTTRVSVANDGSQAIGGSSGCGMTPDGRYVVFSSGAANLVAGDTNNSGDVFVRDLVSGTTQRVDLAADGSQSPLGGGGLSGKGRISADGQVVIFASNSGLTSGDTNNSFDYYVRDLAAGTTERPIVDPGGCLPSTSDSVSAPMLSGDGRLVAFASAASDLVAGDANGYYGVDVFVRDRLAAGQPPAACDTTPPVVVASADRPPNAFGWYVGDVLITWSASDNGGISIIDAPMLIQQEGPSTWDGGACDFDQNCATAPPITVSIDKTPPTATLTTPADGATYSVGQAVTASYACSDPPNPTYGDASASGMASCVADVASGAGVDTVAAGPHTFTVTATDRAGNAATVTHSYTVAGGSANQTVVGPATVTTDPGGAGATTAVPVQTSVGVPAGVAGTVTIATADTTGVAPTGYSFFGKQVAIEAPAAAAASPLVLTFTIDASLLGTVAPADVQIFKNGAPVSGCTDAVAATPDPCVASRSSAPGGDAVITVRTSTASRWNVGRLSYTVGGFYQPVDSLPVVNIAIAGKAVPVKFSLGGDHGLDVFAAGYPATQATACSSGSPTDDIETTVAAGASSLSYDATTGQYTYVWKTDKSWTGCRDLVLRFRDGNALTARFQFRK